VGLGFVVGLGVVDEVVVVVVEAAGYSELTQVQ
jgi:hypothetical protein